MGIIDDLFPRRTKSLPRFDLMTAEEIVEFVGTKFGTARLGKYTKRDLIDAGWFDSFGPDLYDLGSTGLFVAINALSNGYLKTKELYQQQYNVMNLLPTYNLISETALTSGIAYYGHVRRLQVPFTTSGAGESLNSVLVPAVSGYKGGIELAGIMSSITEAATTVVFQDEDDTVLDGCLATGFVLNLTANVMNTQLNGVFMRGPTVNKALEVDITSHGAGGVMIFYIYYNHEA